MSVLINGVEKPKNCPVCRFLRKTCISSNPKCEFLTIDYYCDVLANWKGDKDCPLIEVPPFKYEIINETDKPNGIYITKGDNDEHTD